MLSVVAADADISTDRKSVERCEVRAFDVTSLHRSTSGLRSDTQRKLSVLRQMFECGTCQCAATPAVVAVQSCESFTRKQRTGNLIQAATMTVAPLVTDSASHSCEQQYN